MSPSWSNRHGCWGRRERNLCLSVARSLLAEVRYECRKQGANQSKLQLPKYRQCWMTSSHVAAFPGSGHLGKGWENGKRCSRTLGRGGSDTMRGSWLERGRLSNEEWSTRVRGIWVWAGVIPYGTDDVMKPGLAGEWSWYCGPQETVGLPLDPDFWSGCSFLIPSPAASSCDQCNGLWSSKQKLTEPVLFGREESCWNKEMKVFLYCWLKF